MHNGDDDAYSRVQLNSHTATLYNSGSGGAKCKKQAETGEEVTPAERSKGANASLPHIANFDNE